MLKDPAKASVFVETYPRQLSDAFIGLVNTTLEHDKRNSISRLTAYQQELGAQTNLSETESGHLRQLTILLAAAAGDKGTKNQVPKTTINIASVHGAREILKTLDSFGVTPGGLENLKNLTSQGATRPGKALGWTLASAAALASIAGTHFLDGALDIEGMTTSMATHILSGVLSVSGGVLAYSYHRNVNDLSDWRQSEIDFLQTVISEIKNPEQLKAGETLYFQRRYAQDRFGVLLSLDPHTREPVLDLFHWWVRPGNLEHDPFSIDLQNSYDPSSPVYYLFL
jgi:hypothetical protein